MVLYTEGFPLSMRVCGGYFLAGPAADPDGEGAAERGHDTGHGERHQGRRAGGAVRQDQGTLHRSLAVVYAVV